MDQTPSADEAHAVWFLFKLAFNINNRNDVKDNLNKESQAKKVLCF